MNNDNNYDYDLSKDPLLNGPKKENNGPELSLFPINDRKRYVEASNNQSTSGVKNLKINPEILKKNKKKAPNYFLRRAAAVILGATIIAGTFTAVSNFRRNDSDLPAIVAEVDEGNMIHIENVDFENLLVVLNESGDVRKITAVAESLLEEAGAEVVITKNAGTVKEVVDASGDKTAVVFDINSQINSGGSMIVLTNYDNEDRVKSDMLSYALISETNKISETSLRSGRSNAKGAREETAIEKVVDNAKVATTTLAVPENKEMYDYIANSYGLAIYNASVKYAYNQNIVSDIDLNLLIRTEYNDTISGLKDKYNYSVRRLEGNSGLLRNDELVQVGNTPSALSSMTSVESPRGLSHDAGDEIKTTTIYEVKPGDTLTSIRHALNNKGIGSNLANPNDIIAGQQLSYITNKEGPLIVVPAMVNETKELSRGR